MNKRYGFIPLIFLISALVLNPTASHMDGKIQRAFTAAADPGSPSWPSSWIQIDTDKNEGGGKDWRDVIEAYINYDDNYLYLKLKTVEAPKFLTDPNNKDDDKYRWFIDLEGNMIW